MMLDIFRPLVMKRSQERLDRKIRLAFENFRGLLVRRRLIAQLRVTRREVGMMAMVRRRDVPESRNRLGITPRHEKGAAEMIPEPFGVTRVEPHRLLDPWNALFRPSQPCQDFALLHDDEIVIGIEA